MLWFCSLLLLCFAAPTGAQEYTPVVARVVVKFYEIKNGQKHLVEENVGVFYRGRDGSAYERTLRILGASSEPEDTALLHEGSTGAIYRMFPSTRTATLQKGPRPGPRPSPPATRTDQPTELISGQECTKSVREFSGGQKFITWFAPGLQGLMIKMESYSPGHVMVKTLEDVRTNVEPDAALFQIPRDYLILRGKQQKQR